eukprot:c20440_g1_i1.p1 GENE.c20440_g1_i1~~c20440_g1_i1.p1  ORF type:complete len:540 (-),score=129.08 c20440_g1_i1:596-2215(-)
MVNLVAKCLHSDFYSLTHALLCQLPCREFITTNYDTSLERASWDTGTSKLGVIPYFPRHDCDRWILKMHGCITSPKDIVLTREDYIRYAEKNEALAGVVQSLLITKHMLFVGFSLVDDNFHKIMDSVTRTTLLDTADPSVRASLAQAYASPSTSADEVEKRLKYLNSRTKDGTILSLYAKPLMDEYWNSKFHLVRMDSATLSETDKHRTLAESARKLELFLDFVSFETSNLTMVDTLLCPHFETTLTAPERLARYHLEESIRTFPKGSFETLAFAKLAELARSMGGNDLVDSYIRERQEEPPQRVEDVNQFGLLIAQCTLKLDHFQNIHRLPEPPICEGAPNFRKASGYPVFGSSQPTAKGIMNILQHVTSSPLSFSRVVWVCLRQDPVVYINGLSFAPRHNSNPNENLELPNVGRFQLATLVRDVINMVQNQVTSQNEITFDQDTFAEYPEDRVNSSQTVRVHSGHLGVCAPDKIVQACVMLGYDLVGELFPIDDERAPTAEAIDELLSFLEASCESPGTCFVFNCQMGQGRTTAGND